MCLACCRGSIFLSILPWGWSLDEGAQSCPKGHPWEWVALKALGGSPGVGGVACLGQHCMAYAQLSISNVQFCWSRGYLRRSIMQAAVVVILKEDERKKKLQ